MEVQLTVRYPDNTTSNHRFIEEPITVGSAVANHIVLEEQEVAPHQLIIFREGGGWVVRSLSPEPAIQCGDRPLTPGETRALGHEACLVLGPFVIEWCSDASPVGEAKELARPAAETAPPHPDLTTPLPDRPSPPLASSVPAPLDEIPAPVEAMPEFASATAADLASAFDRLDEPTDAALSPPSDDAPLRKRSRPVTLAAPTASAGPRPSPHAPPAPPAPVTSEPSPLFMAQAAPRTAPLPPALDAAGSAAMAPDAPPAPAAEAAPVEMSTGVATATLPDPGPTAPVEPAVERPAGAAPEEDSPHTVVVPPVTTAPPAMINPRITLNAFRRMYPFRTYPLLVNVTQPAATSDERAESAYVRVVPSLPGCLVTPPAARLDLRRAAVGMRFWVTPMVVGRQKDGWIDVAWEGAPPARLKMIFRVVRQWPAKVLAALAVLTVGVAFLWEKFPSIRPAELEARTPEVVRHHLGQAVDAVGGVIHLGYAVAGVLLLLAAIAFIVRRPRSVALTASRSRT